MEEQEERLATAHQIIQARNTEIKTLEEKNY